MIINGVGEGDYDADGNVLYKYDYNDVLKAYCAKVNSDGVYGVDQTIYGMLQCFASARMGLEIQSAASGCEWLLLCEYYAPEGGLNALGGGTASDPYIVADGDNKIDMTGLGGSANLTFNAPTAGLYTFTTSGTVAVNSNVASLTVNGVTYITVNEAGKVNLTISGNDNSYVLTVASGTTYSATFGDSLSSSGTNESNAIAFIGSKIVNVDVDLSVNESGIYLSFTPARGNNNVTYAFQLISSADGTDESCWIEYDGTKYYANAENSLTLEGLSYGTYVTFNISALASTNVMLRIYKVS
jgi:hypothetical protein